MAFGQKLTNRNSEIERIKAQLIDEDDIVSDDVSSDNEINSDEKIVTSTPKQSIKTSSRRPVFNVNTVEKAIKTSENVVHEEEEDDSSIITNNRRSKPKIDKEDVSDSSISRNRRPNLNKDNIIALSQSVESYFEDDSGREDEIKNEDVAIALHVNQGNNTRAEAFKLKKNNRPSFNNKFISAQEVSSENYYRDAREQSGMENGLDIRLNTLIDRVCEYLNKKDDEIAKIKKEALRNPEAIRGEYQKIYNEVVEPETNKRYETIQSAKKENPDKFIFILVKDDKQKLVGFNKIDHPAYAIYDGVTIKTVSYDRTPFGPPSELFSGDEEILKQEETIE